MQHFVTILEAQRPSAFLWLPVALGIGISLYFSIDQEPSQIVLWLLGVIGALVLIATLALNSVLLRLVLFVILGFGCALFRAHSVAGPKLNWHAYDTFTGRVVAIDRSASNKPRVTFDDLEIEGKSPDETPKNIRISLHGKAENTLLTPGARLKVTANISPPSFPVEPQGFDFQRFAWFRSLGAVGYTRNPIEVVASPDTGTFALKVFKLRMVLSKHIRARIEGQTGAFAAAILTGDRSALDPSQMNALRASNLAHLLAISGLHMGLLTGFVFAFVRYGLALIPYVALRYPTKKISAIFGLLAGASYLFVSGASVATQRAYIMVAVMLVAVLLDRPALTLRGIAIAAILILMLRPESLAGPGFQMSFAATTALVACFQALNASPRWKRFQNGRARIFQPVISLFAASFIAGAATAPFAAFHFNQIAQYGLLANLSSVPIMGALVMPAAVIAGLLSPLGLDQLPFYAMGLGIDWILLVANTVAEMGGALTLVPTPPNILAYITLGPMLLLIGKGWCRWMGVPIFLVGVVIWTMSERPDIMLSEDGRLMGVMTPEGRALNREKGHGYAASTWLENDGDAATQLEASERRVFDDPTLFTVEGVQIYYRWSIKKDPPNVEELCAQPWLIIMPKYKKRPPRGCYMLNAYQFRQKKSMAITVTPKGLKIEGARQAVGKRLWNSRPKQDQYVRIKPTSLP